jgi:hypothetical protein
MSKRFQVTISNEFYDWLVKESEKYATRPATYFTILAKESKVMRESKEQINRMFDFMNQFSKAEYDEILVNKLNFPEMIKNIESMNKFLDKLSSTDIDKIRMLKS